MKINNLLINALLLLSIFILPAMASAVTQKEMEEARTIATKAYLRYANDGSGYLDDINPTTMEELEASLKPKEKENIKAFKAIPVPTDYADWNKEKLLEYWAVTAFQNKGLLEKGRGGRIRARSQINKMTIAPPQPKTQTAPQPTANQEQKTSVPGTPSVQGNTSAALDTLKAEEKTLLAQQEAEDEDFDDVNVEKATNYTWVYIMILAILVAIVVALVVYAANVMKKNGHQQVNHSPIHEDEDAETIENFQNILSDRDVEIAMLKKKLEASDRQNLELKTKIDSLIAELETLKSSQTANYREPQRYEDLDLEPKPQTKGTLRSIFLGRANSRGIFVRADRTLNIGNSIFVLETSDGFSGTFRVADSPAAWSLALSNPKEYLETACTGYDLDNTSSASQILTESAGTAVFEGGTWRVIRKAKIKYEK